MSEWISVDDRLPELRMDDLGNMRTKEVLVAHIDKNGRKRVTSAFLLQGVLPYPRIDNEGPFWGTPDVRGRWGGQLDGTVTHWQRLPKFPKGGNDG